MGYACTPKCRPTFLPSLGAGSPARVWDRRWGQPGTLDGLRETRNSSGLIMRAFRPRSRALQRFGRTSSYFCVDTAPLSPQSSSQEGSEQQTPRGNDSSASIKRKECYSAVTTFALYTAILEICTLRCEKDFERRRQFEKSPSIHVLR